MKNSDNTEDELAALGRVLQSVSTEVQVHPDNMLLAEYQAGHLQGDDRTAISKHLESCRSCLEKVEWLGEGEHLLRQEEEPGKEEGALWEKLKGAVADLVRFDLPALLVPQATAAPWTPGDVPDEELPLGAGLTDPGEVFVQLHGDRLFIRAYFPVGADMWLIGVNDADTGESVGAAPERLDDQEWVCDLGPADHHRGRSLRVGLKKGEQHLFLEVGLD